MDAFFGLDLERKKLWRTPPEVNRGYAPPRSESLSLSLGVESATRMNDFFEAFNVGASQPPTRTPPAAAAGLRGRTPGPTSPASGPRSRRTGPRPPGWPHPHPVFADALGLPADVFDRMTGHSLDVLRMNNYALPPGRWTSTATSPAWVSTPTTAS